MNEMSMEKWWNKISGRRKREESREKPNQTPIRPLQNPHGVIERDLGTPAIGGKSLTACTMKPPCSNSEDRNV